MSQDIIGEEMRAAAVAERSAQKQGQEMYPRMRASLKRQAKTHERAVARKKEAGTKQPTKRQIRESAENARRLEAKKKRHAKFNSKQQKT